jgi:hypothetical protein
MVQLADLLIGAVGYAWNEREKAEGASEAKIAFLRRLEAGLGRASLARGTAKGEKKFNVFDWQGRV